MEVGWTLVSAKGVSCRETANSLSISYSSCKAALESADCAAVTALENELPSIEDRSQTDRVANLDNPKN